MLTSPISHLCHLFSKLPSDGRTTIIVSFPAHFTQKTSARPCAAIVNEWASRQPPCWLSRLRREVVSLSMHLHRRHHPQHRHIEAQDMPHPCMTYCHETMGHLEKAVATATKVMEKMRRLNRHDNGSRRWYRRHHRANRKKEEAASQMTRTTKTTANSGTTFPQGRPYPLQQRSLHRQPKNLDCIPTLWTKRCSIHPH